MIGYKRQENASYPLAQIVHCLRFNFMHTYVFLLPKNYIPMKNKRFYEQLLLYINEFIHNLATTELPDLS